MVVQCWACAVPFDLLGAPWCNGHREHATADPRSPIVAGNCKVCPNGHALHDKQGFDLLPRREPTLVEYQMGLGWVLAGVPVQGVDGP